MKVDIYSVVGGEVTIFAKYGETPAQILSPADMERFYKAEFQKSVDLADLGLADRERVALEQAIASKGYHITGAETAAPLRCPTETAPRP